MASMSMGCMDGPFFAMKQMNPVYREQWQADRELGPTYTDKISEIQLVASQLSEQPEGEQVSWIKHLDNIARSQGSVEMRRQALLALRENPRPEALQTVGAVITDPNEKIRQTAAETLGTIPGEDSIALLQTIFEQDSSTSVRAAVVRSLDGREEVSARAILESAVRDPSPAIQFEATKVLQSTTGADLGGNVQAWQEFLLGEAGG